MFPEFAHFFPFQVKLLVLNIQCKRLNVVLLEGYAFKPSKATLECQNNTYEKYVRHVLFLILVNFWPSDA